MSTNEKHIPVVGEKVTLVHYCGSETPYTVVSVNKTGTKCVIRECGLYFSGPRYFDTKADYIYDDLNGRLKNLFANKWGSWSVSKDKYSYVSWGHWNHEPYTD